MALSATTAVVAAACVGIFAVAEPRTLAEGSTTTTATVTGAATKSASSEMTLAAATGVLYKLPNGTTTTLPAGVTAAQADQWLAQYQASHPGATQSQTYAAATAAAATLTAPATTTAPTATAPTAAAPVATAPAATAPVAAAPAPAPTSTATAAASSSANHGTGVPAGTSLKTVNGDQTITAAGTVLDGLDIHGRVIVKAANVTIKNTIIRGLDSGSVNGLVDAMSGATGLKIYNSEIVATKPSMNVNGIMGWNYELHQVNIHGTVDQATIAGPNVVIADSWLHGNLHYTNDPNQSDGVTHDDNIQLVSGTNIKVTGNVLEGSYNAAIMMAQDRDIIGNMTVSGNTINNGGCSINIAEKGKGAIKGLSISTNKFGLNTRVARCAILSPITTTIAQSANTYTDGVAVAVKKG